MHLLILGGTRFVGRALVDEALARGHTLTLLNRGTRPAPPSVTQLTGDRLSPDGLAALDGRTFDAAIDTWQLDPAAVRHAVTALRGHIKQFVYISTMSVYDLAQLVPGTRLTEASSTVDVTAKGVNVYSANKRAAEIEVEKLAREIPVFVPRPGVILGPGEGLMRLPWWLTRMAAGGRTLAPGPRGLGLRYVDSRDFAAFVLDGVEGRWEGAYNAVSRDYTTTMGELLEAVNEIAGGKAELVWKEAEEILAAGIEPWTEVPIWLAPGSAYYGFVHEADARKAYEAGLRVRNVRETAKDTWEWLVKGVDVPPRESWGIGIPPEKEALVLGSS